MHLIENYARNLGVRIGYPEIYPHFFPCVDSKFITIHNGNKVPSKEYSYWKNVAALLAPELQKQGIKIYQIGTPDEPDIPYVDKRIFTNNLKQAAFVIQNALLHVGTDSVPVHLASAFDIPSVGIYAHTYANTCNAVWNNKSEAVVIESDRGGKKPSFSLQEAPKTLDLIYPERIVAEVFRILKITPKTSHITDYIGPLYNSTQIDVILTKSVSVQLPENSVIRLDLMHDDGKLNELLSSQPKPLTLKMDRPLSADILHNHKDKVSQVVYQTGEFDKNFVALLQKLGIPTTLVCNKKENLKDQRFKFFDNEVHLLEEEEEIKKREETVGKLLPNGLDGVKFFSSKFYLIGDKKFSFLGEVKEELGLPVDKNSDFYIDSDHMMIYHTTEL